ncbi:unnamed protein product [Acanthosepion pharaonis]|uniref:Mediator of RNA polymerase II transcription subunit 15 n=1 Tax=Acanthosepion pharaonis TaxID=158019 RepID=A0A812BIR6_ACAPH|nr:unnamed protein product [Sepia pharaonis]
MSDISSNDWRSPTFRNRVVGQIDKALHQSGSKITKTSVEMENHLYQKAKSRDEYMELLAKLIIHVSELTKKSKPESCYARNIIYMSPTTRTYERIPTKFSTDDGPPPSGYSSRTDAVPASTHDADTTSPKSTKTSSFTET